ncbi:MAG: helical backbone metal receptor [bacterium]|nr:helical backbone metal receptor [bacterium]
MNLFNFLFFLLGFCTSLASKTINITAEERIISLSPSITEIIFTLDEEANVVGVTRFCDKPAKAKLISKIGGFTDPQLEEIIALKPTLVIGMNIPSHQQILQRLGKLKVATLVVSNNKIADISNSMITIGKIMHAKDKADQAVKQFNQDLLSLKNLINCPTSSKILLAVSSKPFIVAGNNTFANEVLILIGAKSAVVNRSPAWPIWSAETMLNNAPRAIVALGGQNLAKELRKELASVFAHKNLKNTVLIYPDTPILQRPGPELVADAKQLANLLDRHGICHFAKK